ncbi:hypothetical protein K1719_035875 [Acacia pycnantha]|nr:hypothetical protein K1719_035875 [Acacia pycnantha]
MKNQKQKDVLVTSKKTRTIKNFSKLKTNVRHCSEVFTVRHCAWRLIIYRGRTDNNVSLAIYLEASDASNLPQGCSVLAAFNLTVVNQVSREESLTRGDADVSRKFYATSYSRGFQTGKSERPKRSSGRSKSGSRAAQPQAVTLSDEQTVASEANLKGVENSYNKAETSSSPVITESGGSGDSSPLLDLTFEDVSEPQ